MEGRMCVSMLMSMCLSALARELGGAKLLFTNTANAELSGDEPFEHRRNPKLKLKSSSPYPAHGAPIL